MTSKIGPKNFTKVARLGTGCCGKVYLVESNGLAQDGRFAMKVVDKAEMLELNRVRRALTERELLSISSHPLIVTLYYSFQTEKYLYLILEYVSGGDFFSIVNQQPNKRLTEKQAQFYGAEVLVALEYLHSLGFLYRDLKPENVLVRASGHVVLSDFDLAFQQSKDVRLNISPTKRKTFFSKRRRRRQVRC